METQPIVFFSLRKEIEMILGNEWFDLEQCEDLNDFGWNVEVEVEEKVKFDLVTCLSPDNEPCILINFDI